MARSETLFYLRNGVLSHNGVPYTCDYTAFPLTLWYHTFSSISHRYTIIHLDAGDDHIHQDQKSDRGLAMGRFVMPISTGRKIGKHKWWMERHNFYNLTSLNKKALLIFGSTNDERITNYMKAWKSVGNIGILAIFQMARTASHLIADKQSLSAGHSDGRRV